MSAPSPAETALRDELAASIDETLRREGRRNEARLAMVRVAALVGLAGSELWFWVTAPAVPFGYRIPTFVYVVFSVALLGALRRGWYRPWVSALMPVLDGLFILTRAQLTFSFHGIEGLEQSMELVTVATGGALLIVSGGFRLSTASLGTATGTGLLLYVWFAMQTRLEWGQMAVHGVILLGIAGAVWLLTTQVRRAVRSEVARVTLARFLPAALLDGVTHDPIALVTRPRAVRATVLVSTLR